jgi:hypothetical protein
MLVVTVPENDKPVVLVGLGYKGLERITTEGREKEASGIVIPTIRGTPSYVSSKLIDSASSSVEYEGHVNISDE